MRILMLAAILVTCSAHSAFAQSSGDFKKVELFGGFSHNRVDTNVNDEDAEFRGIIDNRTGFIRSNDRSTSALFSSITTRCDLAVRHSTTSASASALSFTEYW